MNDNKDQHYYTELHTTGFKHTNKFSGFDSCCAHFSTPAKVGTIAFEEAKKNSSLLPITKIIDEYYGDVQKLGGKRWDTSSLIKRLRK